ncbi:MAG: STAS domain-containing protein [Lachnospiraceae bacterium]|jgi:anti-sigma B factor antagonist|nr:STAS domain-containing protein [Lachnospiraceae bacterium]MBR3484650.1 STAS domain-containing protein [Lachnospiraceae bacterium]MBR3581605.1 STAS domain-containing protein [Lachnospiraceae bacterium]MBR4542044.1 STAS domain-containing protein [Lachnospiraceae bacterium]
MLNNKMEKNGSTELTVYLEGRLDTVTAPQFESELKNAIEGISTLSIDCGKLEYVSSAGLRVLLSAHKIMSKQGSMVVKNLTEEVKEIFDITGFSDILTIQ